MRPVWIAAFALAGCFDAPEFSCAEDSQCVRDGVAGRCELVGYCSFADASCETGRRFAEVSSRFSNVCLPIASACKIPETALEAWRLEIPTDGPLIDQSMIDYALDVRGALSETPFARVAYCLQLDDVFVYTELDDFTGGNVADTGVPTNVVLDVPITNLTVRTNSVDVAQVENASGSIELWPNCYGEGPRNTYDNDDDVTDGPGGPGPDPCYGSFQIHDDDSTIWAYNNWVNGGEPSDLGIGNSPFEHPDWTFANNAGDYRVRTLQAFIVPAP